MTTWTGSCNFLPRIFRRVKKGWFQANWEEQSQRAGFQLQRDGSVTSCPWRSSQLQARGRRTLLVVEMLFLAFKNACGTGSLVLWPGRHNSLSWPAEGRPRQTGGAPEIDGHLPAAWTLSLSLSVALSRAWRPQPGVKKGLWKSFFFALYMKSSTYFFSPFHYILMPFVGGFLYSGKRHEISELFWPSVL